MDRIAVRDLRVAGRVGVTDEERSVPQELVISVEVRADLAAAAASDDLADTVDYDRLVTDIAAVVRSTECRLLEHLAHRIAGRIAAIPGVAGVSVEVGKASPPVKEKVGAITVRIEHEGG